MWPFNPSKKYENVQENPPHPSESILGRSLDDDTALKSGETSTYFPPLTGAIDSRLSIPFFARFPLTVAFGLFSGFVLGAAKGGPEASYKYRAENSHRFPTTKAGWYLYHKSKNYHSIIGGVKEGLRLGGRLSGWAVLCVGSEEVIDQLRGGGDDRQRDFAGTVCAGMAVAGLYSWKNGADLFTSARLAKIALKVSLLYGLTQDALSTLRGRRPAYMDWLLTHVLGQRDKIEA
jgi:hypothetical protein